MTVSQHNQSNKMNKFETQKQNERAGHRWLQRCVRRISHANLIAKSCWDIHKRTIMGEYDDTLRLRFFMAIFTPVAPISIFGIWLGTLLLENPPNDPKLSHGHWKVTPKCNRDNQISYHLLNSRRSGRWLQRGVRPTYFDMMLRQIIRGVRV